MEKLHFITTTEFANMLDAYGDAIYDEPNLYKRLPYHDKWKPLVSLCKTGSPHITIRFKDSCTEFQAYSQIAIVEFGYGFESFVGQYLTYIANTTEKEVNIIKENDTMNTNKFVNFDFGPCTDDKIRMSMYGLALLNKSGEWVSYNKGEIINVDIFNFDGSKFLFKLPVAIKDIKVGDIVIHQKTPVFVTSTEGGVYVVDVVAGEKKEILLTKSPFGFDYATKVVSLIDVTGAKAEASAENPFGINPLLFLLMNDENSSDSMLPLALMMGNKDSNSINPLMLMALGSNSGDNSNLLMALALSNQMRQ